MSGEKTEKPGDGHSGIDVLRWGLALVVALGAGVWYFAAAHDQSICHSELSSAGLRAVQVCGPPRVLDLVPFVLVIGVLLWPDLGELAVTGLITLRRRVDRQEERQKETDTRLVGFDQRLSQLAIASQLQGQAQTQQAVTNIYTYPPDQEDLKRNIGAKEAAGTATPAPSSRRYIEKLEAGLLDEADARQRLVGEFVRDYASLEPYLQRPGTPAFGKVEAELTAQGVEQVVLWQQLFEPEIAGLRQTRNAIVHNPGLVSTETIKGAIDNTRELLRILLGRIA